MRRRIILNGREDRWRVWRLVPSAILLTAAIAAQGVGPRALAGDAETADASAAAAATAAAPNPWIGERVITRYGAVLQVDGKPVDDGGRNKNRARGRDEKIFRVYKVERISGPWFWIVAERSGVKGWVQAGDLIPLDRAVAYYTNQILDNPIDATRYNARGNAHKALGEISEAIVDFTESLRLNPKSVAALDNRGNAWRAQGDYDKALVDFTAAIQLDPNSVYARYNRGVVFRAKKDYDSAIADFTEALRLDPAAAYVHRGRGGAWFAKKEYDKALADYSEAIRLDPEYAVAHHRRAEVWYAKREYDKAIEGYTEAIRLNPQYTIAHHNRGVAWRAKREYDKAIEDFTVAIRLNPKFAVAYNSRGNAWSDKREYDKALADYTKAIQLDPKLATARFNRALARLTMSHKDVVADARDSIDNMNWNSARTIHAAIVGHLGARRVGRDDEATTFLNDAEANAVKAQWPYPIVRFLRREIDEKALLEQATDAEKLTEVRCYVAFDQLLNGQSAEARQNFQWVKDHGSPGFVGLAAAELEGLSDNSPKMNMAAGDESQTAH